MIDWTDLRMDFDKEGNLVSGEIVFSHVDDVTGVVRHFAIERINKDIAEGRLVPQEVVFPTDLIFARFALTHRGVEPHRYNRITPEDVCAYPIVFAHIPGVARDRKDSEHLMIDGTHRYCKAVLQWGWKELRGHVLEPEQWEPYLVRVPDGLDDMERDKLRNQHINPIDSRIK